ncbi:phospholipase D family protein [Halalkalibacter oceani]|uniref:phospholipase D family protein n=1 Tax=Halalkalibacter oceani TaxID=1653776 RepID=UPI00339A2BCA
MSTVIRQIIFTSNQRNRKVMWLGTFFFVLLLLACVAIYHYLKPLPAGLSYESEVHHIEHIEFLYDLTYMKEGVPYQEQRIFQKMNTMIEEAEEFILLDMFLFNEEYDSSLEFPALSQSITSLLVEKKQQQPDLDIIFITDPINTFYGSYASPLLSALEQQGIDVIITDLTKLRDSNPAYSGVYRSLFQWFGTKGDGWLPNPFSDVAPPVTLRSYLQLVNFKANHRKIIVTEKQAMISSANPHDASSYHSNIAFVVEGNILRDIIETERAVAQSSGYRGSLLDRLELPPSPPADEGYQLQLVTEGKIKQHLLAEIKATTDGDAITIGAFYLSDRDLLASLLAASKRGVDVKLILDANKDAFGHEKNGIPNRPVAAELKKKSKDRIMIRWYDTHGEQYHSKLALIEKAKEEEGIVIGGSANFTKRNLDDFNLETDVKITGPIDEGLIAEVANYFETLWTNETASFTLDYEAYADHSTLAHLLYRFQEWSGFSTF